MNPTQTMFPILFLTETDWLTPGRHGVATGVSPIVPEIDNGILYQEKSSFIMFLFFLVPSKRTLQIIGHAGLQMEHILETRLTPTGN